MMLISHYVIQRIKQQKNLPEKITFRFPLGVIHKLRNAVRGEGVNPRVTL